MIVLRHFLICFFVAAAAATTAQTGHFVLPAESDFLPHSVIIKVKPEFAGSFAAGNYASSFTVIYTVSGGNNLHRKFPHVQRPLRSMNAQGQRYADLSGIYEFGFTSVVRLEKLIDRLMATGLFEYAEPHYIPHTCFTPNDPGIAMQYAVSRIEAPAAWGINTTTARGDTNIVIGITDTGVELAHPDLAGNIKHNYADPPGGGDNDGDGYVDNYNGWDLGDNDNDPTYGSIHGVHVCGIADAVTDNGTGMAGIGFRCKFLPVRIENSSGVLSAAYEGIVYAADHGCSVINCSWGGGGGGQLGQDVVNYATINRDALVVAAAGNNGAEIDFFPASYKYVVSVANTDTLDVIAASSNYGYGVDVTAPGQNIYSTVPSGSYMSLSGTSMASPCAAGAAAIIRSFFPGYSALQAGEQLKVTADDIYSLNTATYANKLGYGRVNLFNALTLTGSPSVVMDSMNITDNNDNSFAPGDTLFFRGTYRNYLSMAANVTATLASSSPYVSVVDNASTLGSMPTLSLRNNSADPFRFVLQAGTPVNAVIPFTITFFDAATSYSHTEYFNVIANVDYVNITVNDVATTIAGNGRIGFRNDNEVGGLGFRYMGSGTLLYEAGLMIGTNSAQVSDAVRGTGTSPDADFISVGRPHAVLPSLYSDFDVDGHFKDNLAPLPLPVDVHNTAYAWSSVGNRKYVIVQYVIKNTGGATLNNLYAGIFADWDVDASSYDSNRVMFDPVNQMGYAFSSGAGKPYVGIKLLSATAPVNHYAIDNIGGGGGGVDLYAGGFDAAEKYTTLSTNRAASGVAGAGNDIADVVSTGPFTIISGDSVKLAFALIAGDDLTDLQNSSVNAQTMYNNINGGTTLVKNNNEPQLSLALIPNPAQEGFSVTYELNHEAEISIEVYNAFGQIVESRQEEKQSAGEHSTQLSAVALPSGIYIVCLRTGGEKYMRKLVVTK